MRLRHILTASLILVVTALAGLMGYLLIRRYSPPELDALCSSLQIVILVFSAAAGLLALMKYWHSVEARIEQQQWEKLRYLESSSENFERRNVDVVQAFEWPHLLKEKYLPLCSKALAYDQADDETQSNMITAEEVASIRELDNFLGYFENLYFAVSRHLVKVEDLLIFMRYYIKLLDNVYNNQKDERLKKYIDEYYYNVQDLLNICKKKLKHVD